MSELVNGWMVEWMKVDSEFQTFDIILDRHVIHLHHLLYFALINSFYYLSTGSYETYNGVLISFISATGKLEFREYTTSQSQFKESTMQQFSFTVYFTRTTRYVLNHNDPVLH